MTNLLTPLQGLSLNNKIFQKCIVKREKIEEPMSQRVKLKCVLSLLISTNLSLDCDPASDTIAYHAGYSYSTVVLFGSVKNNQQTHLVNTSRKTVTNLKTSDYWCQGRMVTSLDKTWQMGLGLQRPQNTSTASVVWPFAWVKNIVICEHDMLVNVWEWKSGVKVDSNKVKYPLQKMETVL